MKVLEIKDKCAYFHNPSTHKSGLLQDISEKDVLALVLALYKGEDISFDDIPSKEDCPNDADRVIYTELKQQLDSLQSDLPQILSEIDAAFEDAEAFYSKDSTDETFNDWDPDKTQS